MVTFNFAMAMGQGHTVGPEAQDTLLVLALRPARSTCEERTQAGMANSFNRQYVDYFARVSSRTFGSQGPGKISEMTSKKMIAFPEIRMTSFVKCFDDLVQSGL